MARSRASRAGCTVPRGRGSLAKGQAGFKRGRAGSAFRRDEARRSRRLPLTRRTLLCLSAGGAALLLLLVGRGLGAGQPGRYAHFAEKSEAAELGSRVEAPGDAAQSGGGDISLQVKTETGAETMPLEDYVLGVVAAEMPASFAKEALKAQAVAARTYTVRKLLHGGCGRCPGGLCTDSAHCQAYAGEEQLRARWGEAYAANHAKVEATVRETAGQVLTYDGTVIEALFHSSSEGSTEDCAHVFAQDLPYLKAVSSPEAEQKSEVRLAAADFVARADAAFGDCGLKADALAGQVRVSARYESGRVQTLRLGSREVSGTAARRAFSLRSANFSVAVQGGEVIFAVRGYGHGVGMSQRGADALAAAGRGYAEILAHYYTGTTLADAGDFLPEG